MNNKYSVKNISIILLIVIPCLLYIYPGTQIIQNNTNNIILKYINELNKTCFLNCKTNICKKYMMIGRGKEYFIQEKQKEQFKISSCIVTFWGITHSILYFILTFLLPNFYIEFFFMGIVFELLEYCIFDCHDIKDIIFNSIGILLGKLLSPYK